MFVHMKLLDERFCVTINAKMYEIPYYLDKHKKLTGGEHWCKPSAGQNMIAITH